MCIRDSCISLLIKLIRTRLFFLEIISIGQFFKILYFSLTASGETWLMDEGCKESPKFILQNPSQVGEGNLNLILT